MSYEVLKEKIIDELKKIYDPEIPVNIYELGLIYDIECRQKEEQTTCVITMTLTSAACPVSESLLDQVYNIGYLIEDMPDLVTQPYLVFDPPWSQENISDEAKLQLGML